MKFDQFKKTIIVVLSLLITSSIFANPSNDQNLDQFYFNQAKNALWEQYVKDVQNKPELRQEYILQALKFADKTMRFSLAKIGRAAEMGPPPEEGYPLYIALHGGGQVPAGVNDRQWVDMQFYYKKSVKNGIYIAPRGITNNWNLHFEEESYPLYDKLIEYAILFANVNPNRVYLLGFSAGGDGVYQIVPRMPERFAAANMSAGHHNWIKFDNLYNTPFLMQVGELDSLFERNRVAVQNYLTMNKLNERYNGGYIHDVFVHYNGYHNGWFDNDSNSERHPIIANPLAWLENKDTKTTWLAWLKKHINTNAIDWLDSYTRNPHPEKLVWDLSTSAEKRTYQTGRMLADDYKAGALAQPNKLFYWLDVSVANAYPAKGKLVVETIQASNTINILEAEQIDKFRILLNPYVLNLAMPITIMFHDQMIGQKKVEQKRAIMLRTMLERSDKDQIYNAEMILSYNKNKNGWEII